MKAPAQYDPEAIKKIYNPQEVIAREQAKRKQDSIQAASQQQQQMLQKEQANPYKSFVTGTDSYKNYTTEQSKDNLAKQIQHQVDYLGGRGYKYQHQKDMPFIQEQMALHLSQAGIQDLSQLGYREVESPATVKTLVKKGDKYYESYVDNPYSGSTKLKEVDAFDVEEVTVDKNVGFGMTQQEIIIKGKVKNPPTYELINKETGEKVTQGKYGGQLVKYGDQGFRWGNTTRTEGMTDFMIKFDEKGQALIYPRYEDTATDLSGVLTVGSIALMATGVGAGLGASLTGGLGNAAVQKAIGNAFINATISSATGGDFFKSFLTSAAVPMVSAGMDNVLGNTIFKGMPVDNSFRRIAGAAINRSVTSGVVAAINGQDIGKAMYRGAIKGGAIGGSGVFVDKILTSDNVKFLTDNTNLSFNDVKRIGTLGIAKGVNNIINGQNFSDGLMETFVAHGVSKSVANQVGTTFRKNFEDNPELLSTIQQTTGKLTNLYVRSAISGKPVSPEMLQQLLLQTALKPSLGKGVKKAKEIAQKGIEKVLKDPRDDT
jgi:hypothetical protein